MSKNVEFIDKFIDILGGDNFLLCDMIDQEELVDIQDGLANLIAEYANEGLGLAKFIADKCPNCFKTETV
jgi:hypothetical protein